MRARGRRGFTPAYPTMADRVIPKAGFGNIHDPLASGLAANSARGASWIKMPSNLCAGRIAPTPHMRFSRLPVFPVFARSAHLRTHAETA
jgi:hypothetical protein